MKKAEKEMVEKHVRLRYLTRNVSIIILFILMTGCSSSKKEKPRAIPSSDTQVIIKASIDRVPWPIKDLPFSRLDTYNGLPKLSYNPSDTSYTLPISDTNSLKLTYDREDYVWKSSFDNENLSDDLRSFYNGAFSIKYLGSKNTIKMSSKKLSLLVADQVYLEEHPELIR
ncbi:MAG: hypothetical protein AAF519_18405 [Bacteroidota bacterium]